MTTNTQRTDTAKLRELLNGGTDTEWHLVWYGDKRYSELAIHWSEHDRVCFMPTIRHDDERIRFEDLAALIVAAVNALPALCDAADERNALRAERDRMREALSVDERGVDKVGAFLIESKQTVDPITLSSAIGIYVEHQIRAALGETK